ncbi:MAG: VOC family protein [Ardenticatenaceae bacterium]|nr:VOC family protein [Anaerolineales bacterium]MCB9006383.1 VOC family protein [Ardenticatenaceae bacterium]
MTTFSTGHIGLNVTDLQRSKQFYQELFGFDLAGESTEANRAFAFLADEGKPVLTLWQQSNGRFPTSTPGLHHLSFAVDHIDNVRQVENKLRQMGAKLYYDGIVPHAEGAQSGGIFFEDPDGIRLEVYAAQGADGRSAPAGEAPTCGFF